MAQEASVAPRVFATKQVIWINGFASGSNPITKVRRARTVMPQSFCLLNIEEHTLLARGEETTTSQAIRASNSHVTRVHGHKETHTIFHLSTYGVSTSNA